MATSLPALPLRGIRFSEVAIGMSTVCDRDKFKRGPTVDLARPGPDGMPSTTGSAVGRRDFDFAVELRDPA